MEFYPVHFLWHIATATLFIMSLYSLIIGVRTKLKAFLWYFIYSFFLFIYVQFKSFYYSSSVSDSDFLEMLQTIMHWFVQVIYNCAYCFFFIFLLDVNKYLPKFSKHLKISIIGLFVLSVLWVILSLLLNSADLFVQYFYLGFTPIISIIGIFVLVKLWQIPGKLKLMFFVGGLSYMVFALLALVMSKLYTYNGEDLTGIVPMVYFYSGVIIEQICFGFALGYFTEQVNRKYKDTITQNLKLKDVHNKELSQKLDKQSKRLKKMAAKAKEKKVALIKSEYESKLNESRLSSLHSKMNPHFIFNALNSIKVYLIENDKRKAVTYLNSFSKLVRKILESSRIEKISLKEEVEFIELYVEIENTRLNNSVEFTLNNSIINDSQILVPPLILQPFIENALWHGLAPSRKDKKLNLNVTKEDGSVCVEIEDNGIGRENSLKYYKNNKFRKKSIGIQLTKERFEVFNEKFNTNYHFEFIDKDGEERGTLVKVYFA